MQKRRSKRKETCCFHAGPNNSPTMMTMIAMITDARSNFDCKSHTSQSKKQNKSTRTSAVCACQCFQREQATASLNASSSPSHLKTKRGTTLFSRRPCKRKRKHTPTHTHTHLSLASWQGKTQANMPTFRFWHHICLRSRLELC